VSLSCMHPASERLVWASRVTQILRDEEKARELWKPGLRLWAAREPHSVRIKSRTR